MKQMKPPCPICDRIHAADWAVAVGRFSGRAMTYRAATMPDAPRRTNREQAVADECAWRAAR